MEMLYSGECYEVVHLIGGTIGPIHAMLMIDMCLYRLTSCHFYYSLFEMHCTIQCRTFTNRLYKNTLLDNCPCLKMLQFDIEHVTTYLTSLVLVF